MKIDVSPVHSKRAKAAFSLDLIFLLVLIRIAKMPSSAPKKVYAKMIDYLSYNPVPIPSYNLSADPNHLAEEGEDF
ncbi:hypothetical protein VFPPC_17643 [Pochonia chlamydosporia 170]|uniref:Uncharacterized protein n=1 Tax=Pochonia chlamydosporia 170 TaxID=1380566 RepID=A0A219AQZ9_METCM|nr:hypothetical protein VFPPC_17643 [Pochonia chlamydosporia 170]OWT43181.1 hypothetical protein VFPPC_17643 [Pochonia chlamydosporia 170]